MAVIYLQGKNKWASLGEAVGNLGSSLYEKDRRQDEQKALLDAINSGASAEEITAKARTPTAQKFLQNYLTTKGAITQDKLNQQELELRPKREARQEARDDRSERREVRQEDVARQTLELHQLQFAHTLEQDGPKKAKMDLEIQKLQTGIAKDKATLAGQQFENKLMEKFFQNNPKLLEQFWMGDEGGGGDGTVTPPTTVPSTPGVKPPATPTTKPQQGEFSTKPPSTLEESSSVPLDPVAAKQPLGYLQRMQKADPEFRAKITQIAAQVKQDPVYQQSLNAMNTEAMEAADATQRAADEDPRSQQPDTSTAGDRPSIRIGKGNFSINIPAKKVPQPHKMSDYEVNQMWSNKFLAENLSAMRDAVAKDPDLVGPINQFFTKGSLYFPGEIDDPRATLVNGLAHNMLAAIKAVGSRQAGIQMAKYIQDILPNPGKDAHAFLNALDQSMKLVNESMGGSEAAYKAGNIAYPKEYLQRALKVSEPVLYEPKPDGGWNVVRSIKVGDETWTVKDIMNSKWVREDHRTPQEVLRVLRSKALQGGNPG